jgi:arylsulfatase A-like enzyme
MGFSAMVHPLPTSSSRRHPRRLRGVPTRTSLALAAVVGATVLPCAVSCARAPGSPPRAVVIVSIDTLRPDHLGCYGYARPTSPQIDRFREEAVLFEEAVAHAPSTLSSHASLLSSLLPPHHGASVLKRSAVAPGVTLLAEVLRDAGFATASFNGGGQLHPVWGLDRGFDIYESFAESDGRRLGEDTLRERLDAARGWLESVRNEPFFLFLHTYEVHHPYTPDPERLALMETGYAGRLPGRISIRVLEKINDGIKTLHPGDLEHIVATYDAEISSADAGFGELLELLRELGRYDSSLIVLTSDHGEAFGERGRVGWHGDTLYDEQLRIPLLIRLPGGRLGGTTERGQVRGIDLAPTLLSLLGLTIPEGFGGVALDPASQATLDPGWALAGIDGSPNELAVRTPRWKWYQGRLYDLVADPGERADVASRHPEVERDLAGGLAELVRSREAAGETPVEVDDDLRERLEALGYVN